MFEIDKNIADKQSSLGSTAQEIDLRFIEPNPKQPRTYFDEEALEELAESIKTLGIIQPITVNKIDEKHYTIISGERRYRASKLAGLETVPVFVREVNDQTLHEMALVENIQRQDLNAIEVALSLERLIEECNLTQDVLASRVGKKRSTIANYMRLLKLPVEVQLALRQELISMGHAKALASISDSEAQKKALAKILKKNLSVRQSEELAKVAAQEKTALEKETAEFPASYSSLVEHLEVFFSQNISIKNNKKGGGKIVIDFDSDEDINNFIKKFDAVKH
ncbi:MAG: ParB/RepB/Spo0J family partition protein [Rikenellaceae bacterium]